MSEKSRKRGMPLEGISPAAIVQNQIKAQQGEQMVKLLTKKLKIANEKIEELEAKLEVLTNQTQTL